MRAVTARRWLSGRGSTGSAAGGETQPVAEEGEVANWSRRAVSVSSAIKC